MNIGPLAVGAAALAWVVATAVVCWLKGKRLWATLGFLSNWHAIPAFRLAKPNSWWADRFYDEEKQRRALLRFGLQDVPDDYEFDPEATMLSDEDLALQDKITRKAWAKARKERERAR